MEVAATRGAEPEGGADAEGTDIEGEEGWMQQSTWKGVGRSGDEGS